MEDEVLNRILSGKRSVQSHQVHFEIKILKEDK